MKTDEVIRPEKLECDIFRFCLNGNKWIVFVGLDSEKMPFEVFIGNQKENSIGEAIPYSIKSGFIEKSINGLYNFQYIDKMGYEVNCSGVNREFSSDYDNLAITLSYQLRYVPLKIVLKMIKKWKHEKIMKDFQDVIIRVLSLYNYCEKEQMEIKQYYSGYFLVDFINNSAKEAKKEYISKYPASKFAISQRANKKEILNTEEIHFMW